MPLRTYNVLIESVYHLLRLIIKLRTSNSPRMTFDPTLVYENIGRSLKCSLTHWMTYYANVTFMTLMLKNRLQKKKEVEYVIGSSAVVPAAPRQIHFEAQNAVPEAQQYPPLPPAPAPAPPEDVENQLFSEHIQPVAQIQVHFDSPEPSVSPKLNTVHEISLSRTEMSDTRAKSRQSWIAITSSSAQLTPAASQTQRIRFGSVWLSSRNSVATKPNENGLLC